MFVCLSSGTSPRYREDIIRALALPTGTVLQFRYDKRYWTQAVRTAVEQGTAKGQDALIVYIDQATQGQPPTYAPCRYAQIKNVAEHGTTVSLELVVGEYAYAENLAGFNHWISATFPADLPAWQEDKIQGKYWLKAPQEATSVVRTNSLGDWEKVVTQLAAHTEFDAESCFYTVTSVRRAKATSSLVPVEGAYQLKGGKSYELAVYHYHPNKQPTDRFLEVKLAGGGVEFTTNPVMRIDSRYDQKVIRFQTHGNPTQKIAFLTFVWGKDGYDATRWSFDLPIAVQGMFWQSVGYAIAVAVLLAGPQLFSAWNSVDASDAKAVGKAINVTIVTSIVTLVTGVFAVFALKKPW